MTGVNVEASSRPQARPQIARKRAPTYDNLVNLMPPRFFFPPRAQRKQAKPSTNRAPQEISPTAQNL